MRKVALLVASLLLCITVNGWAFTCEVSDTVRTIDDITNDGSSYVNDGINETITGRGSLVFDAYDNTQVTGIAMRKCTTTSGACTLTGNYHCNPMGNCSYYTLPNGHTLGAFSSTYRAMGIIADPDNTLTQFIWSLPNGAGAPNGTSGVSVRFRLWLTFGGSSAFPSNLPWDSGTNLTVLCKDL